MFRARAPAYDWRRRDVVAGAFQGPEETDMTEGDPRDLDHSTRSSRRRGSGSKDRRGFQEQLLQRLARRRWLSDEHRTGGGIRAELGLGWLVDTRMGTKPWFMISFIFWAWWRRFSTSCGCPRTSSGKSINRTNKDLFTISQGSGDKDGVTSWQQKRIRRSSNSQSHHWRRSISADSTLPSPTRRCGWSSRSRRSPPSCWLAPASRRSCLAAGSRSARGCTVSSPAS